MGKSGLDLYLEEMWYVKNRMKAIEIIATHQKSTSFRYTDIEFMTLQIRKIIEHIAMGNLVVNKELYNEYNDKFSSNWNAKYIFRDLERLNPQFYPIPVKTDYTVEPKRWVNIDEAYLTKDEAVKIYDKCGGLMHVPNPYGSQVDVFYYEKMIPIWYKKIFYLLNQHVIHMVGGEQMYCIVMCGDKNDNPHGYLFESVQNEPD